MMLGSRGIVDDSFTGRRGGLDERDAPARAGEDGRHAGQHVRAGRWRDHGEQPSTREQRAEVSTE